MHGSVPLGAYLAIGCEDINRTYVRYTRVDTAHRRPLSHRRSTEPPELSTPRRRSVHTHPIVRPQPAGRFPTRSPQSPTCSGQLADRTTTSCVLGLTGDPLRRSIGGSLIRVETTAQTGSGPAHPVPFRGSRRPARRRGGPSPRSYERRAGEGIRRRQGLPAHRASGRGAIGWPEPRTR